MLVARNGFVSVQGDASEKGFKRLVGVHFAEPSGVLCVLSTYICIGWPSGRVYSL